ncbi:MAG: DUF505 domain-containing protein [Candidatus Hydrogenedentota bacterium]|nr:MAG: DUF505 domain-containing protein [Candidatus Hydrogenedentota bacterium]
MVITKLHAVALEKLLQAEDEARTPIQPAEVGEEVARELEAMGLVRFETPVCLALTYKGRELTQVLRELVALGPTPYAQSEDEAKDDVYIVQGHGLPPISDWDDAFRFLGSEVIAMLDAARRAHQAAEHSEEPLLERGLAARVRHRKKHKDYVALTEQGLRILEIYETTHPRLEINHTLADAIRALPMGPTPASNFPATQHDRYLLEGMRLISYSVPHGGICSFTALGQAVKQALETGGFGEGDVLTEDILAALANYTRDPKADHPSLSMLQALGYVGADGDLLPAGEWALEAYRLLREGPRSDVWTIAVHAEDIAVLRAIDAIWQKATSNREEAPTFEKLRTEMIDRKVRQYKALLEKYGRKLNEMPHKYQQIASKFQEAKNYAQWFDDNFDLRAVLHSLESFQLIESIEDRKGREVFRLTEHGQRVLADGAEQVSSTSVKSITMTRKTFSSPNRTWYNEAVEEGLIGTAAPTKRGYLYANLAETIHRLPFLTRFEQRVFDAIPEYGMTVSQVFRELEKEIEPEWIKWALEKLEARHLIEVLPDGNIVETEAGKLLDRALSGVPKGMGFPVTPLIVRVLQAVAEVGSLYRKERCVRILPRQFADARRRSGLAGDAFQNALELARAAGYMGQNSINEAGLLILEAVAKMNPSEKLAGHVGFDSES